MYIVQRKYYAILNFINVYPFHLKYIIVMYPLKLTSNLAIMFHEAHMYLQEGLYHIHPLHENQIFWTYINITDKK